MKTYRVGDRVIRTSEPSTRAGEVVEVLADGRCRVRWDGLAYAETASNADRTKRTFIKAGALAPATPENLEIARQNLETMRWNYQYAVKFNGRLDRRRARPYRAYVSEEA